jgi:hypothetical protein
VRDHKAGGSEVFLFAHPFAVGGEVAEQVRPADLTAGGVEVVVAGVTIGADDPAVALAEHDLRLGGVPARRDPEHGSRAGKRAPERPAVAAGLPPGLVDVHDRRALELLLQPGVRRGERLAGPLDDRVDRPGRKLDAEQLAGELGGGATGDPVAHRERDHRSLEPRPERPPRRRGSLGRRDRRALRTADAVQPILGHPNRGRRQLAHLTPPRLGRINTIGPGEHPRARPAPLRPMLDHLVDPLGRKQPPVATLVPVLPTPLAA